MKKPIDYASIKEFSVMRKPMTLQDAVVESGRCLLCEEAPCSKGCPAGTDPGKFVRQIRFVNYKGAARTIRNNNVMGLTCALTCPVEKLCEKECCSKMLGDPINISGLQRFACEYGKDFKLELPEKRAANRGNVAVVGAGPAGLSCAATLASLGYQVSVFEKEDSAGGVPMWSVPPYRLPRVAIDDAANYLKQLGVSFYFGKAIEGKDAAKKLLAEGYKACFVSTGLGSSMGLPILNGYQNVSSAKDFLRQVKFGPKPNLSGKHVVVIGGGSVAMDAAVSAKALGAKRVCAVSLESQGELPADAEEIELARGIDVVLKPGAQIMEVVGNGKNVQSLKGIEIEWREPNNFTSANAKPIEGTEFNLRADYVVQAIGSAASADVKNLADGLKFKARGGVVVGEDFSTDVPGIFAGGDISNGGATIAKAVGDGKLAAEGIDKYITRGK